MKARYPNFHVELGTIISTWNVNDIEAISRFAIEMEPDSYRNEIAEKRSEMFNREDPVTPITESYKEAVDIFVRQVQEVKKNSSFFQRINNAFRMVYYNLAIRIMDQNVQVIPCYAGISNAHMSPYGDIWACCTLGYEKSMGNVRDYNYDFQALWNSSQAEKVRTFIKEGNCHCPLANQAYSNILMHVPSLIRVMKNLLTG
jgi:hypothetical protein